MTALLLLAGYLSGSVLYAPLFARLLGKDGALERSRDGNPGTANAFVYGGFLCGVLTLACELAKGALPVLLWRHTGGANACLPLMLAAPVAGHVLPLWHGGRGGKGIAVTFGVLLGLLPEIRPVAVLAACFLFFTLVVRIHPHRQLTLATYLAALPLMYLFCPLPGTTAGFVLIAMLVCVKLLTSREPRERMRVKLLWMR